MSEEKISVEKLYDLIEEKLSDVRTLLVVSVAIFGVILASDVFLKQYISSLKLDRLFIC